MSGKKVEREQVLVYLDPVLASKLRHEKADTKQTISSIIEDMVRARYERGQKAGRRTAAASA